MRVCQPVPPASGRDMLAKPPLIPTSDHPSVYVAHGNGPYANTRRALESVGLLPVRGKRVLLKPNVGRVAAPGSGIVTHPEVVAAAIDVFREAGAEVRRRKPHRGRRRPGGLCGRGHGGVAAGRGCPLIDMDRRPASRCPCPRGR